MRMNAGLEGRGVRMMDCLLYILGTGSLKQL